MLLSVLAFFAVSAAAQDFVTKRNGEDIAAIVDEVGPDYVKFRLWNEPDGVVYNMRTAPPNEPPSHANPRPHSPHII